MKYKVRFTKYDMRDLGSWLVIHKIILVAFSEKYDIKTSTNLKTEQVKAVRTS